MTLSEALQDIDYSTSWFVWSKKIDGKFKLESETRYGNKDFTDEDYLEDLVYVCNGEYPKDWAERSGYNYDDSNSWVMDELVNELNK